MNKHTEGPWQVCGLEVIGPDIKEKFDNWSIATCNCNLRRGLDGYANAKLIAMAPVLLQKLQKLVNVATHPKTTKAQIKLIADEARIVIAQVKEE